MRASGSYLAPEPLMQSPAYMTTMAFSGFAVPTYAYAANNPLRYIDRDGRLISSRIRIGAEVYGPGVCGGASHLAGCNSWDVGEIEWITECRVASS